ncbi:MAG TPA: hypothetical protein VFI70_07775 [Nitrososphaeraceae archaeon]|nr:hypothetical protein [Nitrososphaeraceae archaeon]
MNLNKHKSILDDFVSNELISSFKRQFGVRIYKPTQKRIEFCKSKLQPYEKTFPRSKDSNNAAKE